MGKNQQHKQSQRARHGSSTGGGEGGAEDATATRHLGVDASFHTPAWHEARLAALQMERPSYEDWKLRQKEAQAREDAEMEEQDRLMREYKDGLEADRAQRLGTGPGVGKKERRDRDSRSKKSKKEKRERKDRKDKKSSSHKHSKSKRSRRDRSSDSESDSSSGDERTTVPSKRSGPVKLSEFFAE